MEVTRHQLAALVAAVFAASLSILFPRLAPVAFRVGAVAILAVAALWLYDYLTARPPPLASKVLALLRSRGPMTLGELVLEAGADHQQVEEALRYLTRRLPARVDACRAGSCRR